LGRNSDPGEGRQTKQNLTEVGLTIDGLSAVLVGELTLCHYLADLLVRGGLAEFASPVAGFDPVSLEAALPQIFASRTTIKIEQASYPFAPEPEGTLRLRVSALTQVSVVAENNAARLSGPAALISSDDDSKTVRQAIGAVARGVYFVSSRTGRG